MTIGIPKVVYQNLGIVEYQWVDIYTRLSRERVLFLTQEFKKYQTNQLIGLMLYLSSEDENFGMFIYMNSSGGSIICRLSLVDTVQYIHSRVGTVNVGIVGSIAAFVLSSGKKGKRIALSHARFIIHQPESGSQGQATEIFIEVNEVIRIRGIVKRLYSKFTGKTLNFITLGMNRDEFLNAKQACEYGIIDLIGKYARYLTTTKKN